MGEIGEVIQAERIGLRQKERRREGERISSGEEEVRPSVFSAHFVSSPNIHWITLPLARPAARPEIRARQNAAQISVTAGVRKGGGTIQF